MTLIPVFRAIMAIGLLVLSACAEAPATNDPTPDAAAEPGLDAWEDIPSAAEVTLTEVSDGRGLLDGGAELPAPVVTQELPETSGRIPSDFTGGHACWPRTVTDRGEDWADNLVDSGCYAFQDGSPTPSAGAIRYRVKVPLWSDAAAKVRYLFLPEATQLGWRPTASFDFPDGTVILKEFYFDGELVESRFVLKSAGTWEAATYRWNGERTEAFVVRLSEELTVGEHTWLLPGIEDCKVCHTNAAGFVLGLRGDQLFHDVDMFGMGPVNQVSALNDLGLFQPPLPSPVALRPLAALDDVDASLEARARSYMASNCANCHQPGGAPHSDIDLRIETPLSETRACDVYPSNSALGLGAVARLIAPGEPEHSLVALRMALRDDQAMPQLGSFVVHDAAVELLQAWIASLEGCD